MQSDCENCTSFKREGNDLTKKNRQYSSQTKLAALAAIDRNGGNVYKTAREIGVPSQTLSKWVKAQREGKLPQPIPPPEPVDDDTALDERLEQLARQMVAVMPEKVEEANLQELARALTIVLDTMKQARSGKEQSGEVYEKLARLMDRFAPKRPADGDVPPADGERTG